MLIFTLSFFQLQQEKFRVGLAELSKNFQLVMSCDRTAMFVLHVDTFKARATFAPRSQAVKNKLWSLVTVQVWQKICCDEQLVLLVYRKYQATEVS